MRILQFLSRTHRKSANIAKDRLQIIVARERRPQGVRDYLPLLHQELVQVIAKYEAIDPEKVTVNLDRTGEVEVLELNIVLPEEPRPPRHAVKATSATAPLQT